jgi:hypothetical protein
LLPDDHLRWLVTHALDELQHRGANMPDDLANEFYSGAAQALETSDHWQGRAFLVNLTICSWLLGNPQNQKRWLAEHLATSEEARDDLREWLKNGDSYSDPKNFPELAEMVHEILKVKAQMPHSHAAARPQKRNLP